MAESLKDLLAETTGYKLPTYDEKTTNWTPNTSTLLAATNKNINDNIDSAKAEGQAMKESLDYYYDKREKALDKRTKGLFKVGTDVALWIRDERKAHKIYTEHEEVKKKITHHKEQNRILDLYKDNYSLELLDNHSFNWDVTDINSDLFPSFDESEIKYLEAYNEKANVKAQLNAELFAWDQNSLEGLDPFELYLLTSDTDTGQEIEDKEALFQRISEFQSMGIQVASTHVFRAGSITNNKGELLPRDMSYFDALESSNISDNAWAPYLEQALWSAYYAYWNKDYKLSGLSDREIKNRIFKPFLEEVAKNRSTIVNSLLDKRVSNAKQKRGLNLLNILNSSDPLTGGMAGITGPGGYIAQNEIGIDGSKDNAGAWASFANDIESMARNEIIWDGNKLQKVLEQPFIRRDNGKETTLAEFKPGIYARLSKLATDLKSKAATTNALNQKETISNALAEVTPIIQEALDSGDQSQIAGAQETLLKAQQRVAKELGITETHPDFNDFRRFSNKLSYSEANDAITELTKLQNETGYLNWSLINKIPDNYDAGLGRPNEKAYWTNQANKYGAVGLGGDELEFYKLKIEGIVRALPKYRPAQGRSVTSAFIRSTPEFNNMLDLFLATNVKVNKANERELRLETDNDKKELLEKRFAEESWVGVFENVISKQPIEKDKPYKGTMKLFAQSGIQDKPIVEGTVLTPFQVESNQLADTFSETKGEYNATVDFPYYWSKGEEEALKQIILYRESNGTKGTHHKDIQYYNQVMPNGGRKFPTIPIEQVINARIEATKDLRKDGNTKDLFFSSGADSLSVDDYRDLCVYPSVAKTGQKLCSNNEIGGYLLANSVENYEGQVSDINTIRSGNVYKKSIVEGVELSTMTLRDVLVNTDDPFQRYGKYGLTAKRIDEQIQKQGIDPDSVFDDNMQNQIMFGLILEMANKGKEFNTLSSDYRRIKWLSPEAINGFKTIINSENAEVQKYLKSPYNQFHTLSRAASNELLNLVSGD